jgi:photosystem II stability/assembly factor-like uncharacterized protein
MRIRSVTIWISILLMRGLPQHTWMELANPSRGPFLSGVAWNGGMYVAVGEDGVIVSSRDGMAWTEESRGRYRQLSDVIWDGKAFIAVGAKGLVLASEDGKSWDSLPSPTRKNLRKVIFTGEHYVVSGDSGVLLRSPRLAGLEIVDLKTDKPFISLCQGGGAIVAFTLDSLVYTSENSLDWSAHDAGIRTWSGSADLVFTVLWDGTRFVAGTAGGKIAVSRNGIDWEIIKENLGTGQIGALCWSGSQYLVGGVLFGELYSSRDGRAWEKRHSPNQHGWHGFHCGEGRMVAVGNSGRKYFSEDGNLWKSRYTDENVFISGLARSDSSFIGVGDAGNVIQSGNGKDWILSGSMETRNLHDVEWTGQGYLAVGDSGAVLASADGTTWNKDFLSSRTDLRFIRKIGRRLFIGGDSTALFGSLDGKAWMELNRDKVTQKLNDMAYKAGTLVAVGDYGKIFYSTDSVTWGLSLPRLTDNDLKAVTFFNGKFFAAGEKRTLLVSDDGFAWKDISGPGTPEITSFAVIGDELVATGNNEIHSSHDGSVWSKEYLHNTSMINSIETVNGVTVAAGSLGMFRRVPVSMSIGRTAPRTTDSRAYRFRRGRALLEVRMREKKRLFNFKGQSEGHPTTP